MIAPASIDLTGELQSLDRFPGLCATACDNVFLEDLCRRETGHLYVRCSRCSAGRIRGDDLACCQQQ
jgi:hypothetical protein